MLNPIPDLDSRTAFLNGASWSIESPLYQTEIEERLRPFRELVSTEVYFAYESYEGEAVKSLAALNQRNTLGVLEALSKHGRTLGAVVTSRDNYNKWHELRYVDLSVLAKYIENKFAGPAYQNGRTIGWIEKSVEAAESFTPGAVVVVDGGSVYVDSPESICVERGVYVCRPSADLLRRYEAESRKMVEYRKKMAPLLDKLR